MPKKAILLTTLLFCLFNLNAQENSNVKLAVETGILPLSSGSENLAFFLNVEPKIKVSINTFIGLRFGITLNPQTFENYDLLQFNIDNKSDHALLSFVPTVDYYLNDFSLNENPFRSYLGLGIGYHLLSDIDISRTIIVNPSEDVFEASVKKRIGLLLRGGLESNKLRFGLEYSLIPKADIEIPNGQTIGTVKNSYLGLSIGFIIGGRRNKRQ